MCVFMPHGQTDTPFRRCKATTQNHNCIDKRQCKQKAMKLVYIAEVQPVL